MGSRGQHIVMLPFLAHGHLIPFLALARQLQQTKGFTITIVSTPLNIQYLQSTLSSDSPDIRLAELPFCSTDHGLPPNAENTENLSLHNIPTLCHASVTLEAPFRRLIRDIMDREDGGRPPRCIISDLFFGRAVNVAKSIDSEEFFKLPRFPDSHRFRCSQLNPLAKVADRMEVLRKYLKLPVRAIGPLLPAAALKKQYSSSSFGSNIFKQRAGKKLGISPEKCIEWLNLQGPGSVLYISFGSQNTISASQMMEPPTGFDINGEFEEWLPEGFEKRKAYDCKQTRLIGAQLGTAAGDFVTRIYRSIFKPLWVELGIGELKPRCSDYWVTDGSGADVQFEDAGGGDGCVRGVGKGSAE
ncbi:hypothetical protein FH972_013084 [Carpinus fangiana]|uniref:Uncharacterized protein n=1 Tax=Carpinus fangiana TaxID=176857 RepID=A0A5N6R6M9_9ROSI|nr:hypothetical protein FH972_013084 [Carpinus fangiana]